jgi:hypothetical protein
MHPMELLGEVGDEDINTTPTPSLAPLGPLTRARVRQLNHQE